MRKLSSLSLAPLALAWSFGCAADVQSLRPNRPPWPSDQAVDELELVCQPDEDGCRPTRVVVEVCASSGDPGCDVRRGFHDFLSELEAYDRYVAELRGDPPPPDPVGPTD